MTETITTPDANGISGTITGTIAGAMNDFLSADAILGANDAVYAVVPCPEWGGNVRLRTFTGEERARFEARLAKRGSAKAGGEEADDRGAAGFIGIREEALWLTAVDGSGKRIFTDPKQVRALRAKNAAPLDRCFNAVLKLSGMTKEEQDKIARELKEDPFEDGSSE